MSIKIKISDGGRGRIIESHGAVTGQELVDFLRKHFVEDEAQLEKCQYILFDYTALRKLICSCGKSWNWSSAKTTIPDYIFPEFRISSRMES